MSEEKAPGSALMRFLQPKKSSNGSVSTSLLSYISPGLWATFIAVGSIVGLAWEELSTAFVTNIPLNGLIVFVMLTGLTRSIMSNLICFRTSRYMAAIDAVVAAPERPNQEHVADFKARLKRQASVLDTKQFVDLLDNLPEYGHLNITDNDARMVKSKVGYRVSLMRNNTGFLAGLLVMLGLLGTFWGLLATIDAVGKAMGGMANIGGADAADMSGFLGAIAAPLEGMGLAFSSSLFGLSGSLLIGFTNFLCGGVHNTFIEGTSRWIDERIPKPSAAANKGKQNPKVAGSDELKAWLVGFVQVSIETNKQVAQLVASVREATATSLASARNTRKILGAQEALNGQITELQRSQTRGQHILRKEINDRTFELANRLRGMTGGSDTALPNEGGAEEAAMHVSQSLNAGTSPHEARDQINTLVEHLQELLEQQDTFQQMRARERDDTEGLPPSLKPENSPEDRPDTP